MMMMMLFWTLGQRLLITAAVPQNFSSDGESPFPFQGSFQTNQWEGRSDPVRGKFPGFPPYNTTLAIILYSLCVRQEYLTYSDQIWCDW